MQWHKIGTWVFHVHLFLSLSIQERVLLKIKQEYVSLLSLITPTLPTTFEPPC